LIICVLEWSAQDLVASWTLVGNKTGATRLGFAGVVEILRDRGAVPERGG